MARSTPADQLLNEVALYGGFPLRRCDILTVAAEDIGKANAGRTFGADWFAFHPPAVNMDPWPIDEYRAEIAAINARARG